MSKKIATIIVLAVVLGLVGWGIYRLMAPKVAQSNDMDGESLQFELPHVS